MSLSLMSGSTCNCCIPIIYIPYSQNNLVFVSNYLIILSRLWKCWSLWPACSSFAGCHCTFTRFFPKYTLLSTGNESISVFLSWYRILLSFANLYDCFISILPIKCIWSNTIVLVLFFFSYENIHIIWFCSNWLAMSNSCYNPFVYGLLNVSREWEKGELNVSIKSERKRKKVEDFHTLWLNSRNSRMISLSFGF